MLSLQLNIPYKCIVNTKSLKRCNSCPEYPNNTKFSPQSNFSMNISILGFISAEHEDKRKRKNARIGEYCIYARQWRTSMAHVKTKPARIRKFARGDNLGKQSSLTDIRLFAAFCKPMKCQTIYCIILSFSGEEVSFATLTPTDHVVHQHRIKYFLARVFIGRHQATCHTHDVTSKPEQ